MPEDVYDKITKICLRRGIIYPSSEIHGGIAGFYDYGSVGAKIKRNFESYWRRYFLGLSNSFYEIDTTNVMPEAVFKASGHLTEFVDPLTKCTKCGLVERADHILEEGLGRTFEGLTPADLDKLIKEHKIKCPKCGGSLKETETVNMMFSFDIGYTGGTKGYLRPETAQGAYVSFKREYAVNREKLPLGLAIVGKAYRNELSPRQGVYRMREFSQAELQIFFDPKKIDEHPKFSEVENYKINIMLADERKKGVQSLACKQIVKKGLPKFFVYYMAKIQEFYESLGTPLKKFRFYEKNEEERAFYNKYQFDAEIYHESHKKFLEVMGYHYRTDFDLTGHQKTSKTDLTILKDGRKFIPHVIELSIGIDRSVFALLDLGYKEEGKHVYFSLHSDIAPYVAGIYPLVNKDNVDKKAEEVYEFLRKEGLDVFYDSGGSIGRRYARADEIGVNFGITIDYDTLKDSTVTVRDRDSTKQKRVKIEDLPKALKSNIS